MMNTSDERITGLSDEALDVPTKQALNCAWLCGISDEALDPAPAQEAAACVCGITVPCMVSDEALDPAQARQAVACFPGQGLCYISDEALDPAPALEVLACSGTSSCVFCAWAPSDEAR